ncbi:MAG: hydrolase [Gammaproteobacteria bacterium]|nr:MAG: hydrolase [Gammaproteobacteria bacterium]
MSDFNIDAHLCNADNSCLVVIDIQTRLTSAMPIKVLARLKRNINILLQGASRLSIPVLATEQYPKGLGPTEPEIVELFPDDTLKFEKTCFSCTGAEQFLQKLEETGRKQVIIVGIEAHVCVLQTAIQLIAEGYQVFVVADCICSRHRENYEASLKRMSQAGVVICNAESVLFEWLRDAKHDNFKELSQLVL